MFLHCCLLSPHKQTSSKIFILRFRSPMINCSPFSICGSLENLNIFLLFGERQSLQRKFHLLVNLCVLPVRTSVQFSLVAQSCLTLCDPMNCSTPGLPVHHQLPELAQTHVCRVGDAIQPSHPLSSPSPPAFNLSQHQGLFK